MDERRQKFILKMVKRYMLQACNDRRMPRSKKAVGEYCRYYNISQEEMEQAIQNSDCLYINVDDNVCVTP